MTEQRKDDQIAGPAATCLRGQTADCIFGPNGASNLSLSFVALLTPWMI